MLDFDALDRQLAALGLDDWIAQLRPLLEDRMSGRTHGDFARWRAVVEALPGAHGDEARLRDLLLGLQPWRKGPLSLGGVDIDTEWRSDWKWARLADAIEPLDGRNILDVGCGNGYYALRMRAAGARCVIGVDPTLLYAIQFLAINVFHRDPAIFVLPLRLEETPDAGGAFDTTFSMGVLYHQREPGPHLGRLRETLRPGGQLVLETLYVPGEDAAVIAPQGRYARMRNVWQLPTVAQLVAWIEAAGYAAIEVVNKSRTTTAEQRSTEWMSFESLRESLDPRHPDLTVEGLPAPRRVIITATRP